MHTTSQPTGHKQRSRPIKHADAPTVDTPVARSRSIPHWLARGALALLKWAAVTILALLAALEGRLESAVRLAGYADASYAAFGLKRQPNEAAAVERAHSLARTGIGDSEYERLLTEGSALTHQQIASIAFEPSGPADAPSRVASAGNR